LKIFTSFYIPVIHLFSCYKAGIEIGNFGGRDRLLVGDAVEKRSFKIISSS